MKRVYELEQKNGIINYDLDRDNYPTILGLDVYIPFFDDWIEIEADDLTIRQINDFTNDVLEYLSNNKMEKEYDSELEFY